MRLKKILKDLEVLKIQNFKNYNIKSITHISTDVEKNSIFVCIKGNNFDGNVFIEQAILSGAKCLITEEDINVGAQITVIKVKDVRIAMSIIAKNFYNQCCDKMKIIGIVGTAGKTTTSIIIANLLKENDKKIGIIGTNGIYIGDIKLNNNFTTPDPLELHYIFYQMIMLGVKTVVMEISAQAIFYKKMYGIYLDICVFTNISEEHLDFFGSMEKYARCKMDYFNPSNMKECVVNVDDFFGMEIAYKTKVPCVSYATHEPANSFAIDIKISINGTQFVANIIDDVVNINSKLVGQFNVYNLIAGMTVAKMLGIDIAKIKNTIDNLNCIEGRFNLFENKNKKVLVDFAHTPDSFEKTLSLVKTFVSGKIILIFGCVGYSNFEKRVEMGRIADKYSNIIIITTDNRGTTCFEKIAEDICQGIVDAKIFKIEDRVEAIKKGLELCKEDDILCILGKGAENFQMIENTRVKYSDIETVNKLLFEE